MNHELFQPDAELLDALLADPSSSLLREFFQSRLSRADTPFIHDECFTFGLFDDLVAAVSPSGAFALLPSAIQLAQSEAASTRFACALALVASLAHRSDTTEQPPYLREFWPAFTVRVAALSPTHDARHQLQSIRDWYRLQ